MTLSKKDKQPNQSGWGYTFNHTAPQRHLKTVAGSLLVPASADDLPRVPEDHLVTVERAISLIADLLADRDHQLFMGEHHALNERADAEAAALRRLIGPTGMLRTVLGPPSKTNQQGISALATETPADAHRGSHGQG